MQYILYTSSSYLNCFSDSSTYMNADLYIWQTERVTKIVKIFNLTSHRGIIFFATRAISFIKSTYHISWCFSNEFISYRMKLCFLCKNIYIFLVDWIFWKETFYYKVKFDFNSISLRIFCVILLFFMIWIILPVLYIKNLFF